MEDVVVSQVGIDKENRKSRIEFVSIAYSDLFGQPLSADRGQQLVLAYESIGDEKAVEDMIIRNRVTGSSPGSTLGIRLPSTLYILSIFRTPPANKHTTT